MQRRVTGMGWIAIFAAVLSGCAAGPKFDASGVDQALTPQQAAAEMERLRGSRVIWGGTVLGSHHNQASTQIEVLAYPLDSRYRPDTEASSLGRFLIIKQGYIETADFAPGRSLSVSGTLQRSQPGQIGEVTYHYPVVEPLDLFLWPREDASGRSNVQFGFGLGIIR